MTHRIRAARVAAGLTQLELANRAGISQQQLSKLERGLNDLSLKRAAVMAGILGCPALDLMPPMPAGFSPATDGAAELELLQTFRLMAPDRRDLFRTLARTMLRSEPVAQAPTGT